MLTRANQVLLRWDKLHCLRSRWGRNGMQHYVQRERVGGMWWGELVEHVSALAGQSIHTHLGGEQWMT